MKVKDEITRIVDSLPNEVLDNLLEYLKLIEETTSDQSKRSLSLRKILEEDKHVLSKLAK